MPAKVTLKITRGKLQGQEFVFVERTSCIIGRGEDCQPQLPSDDHHRTISRHHCLLDINPPDIRVRDFGSLNGTHVNGAKIGQREKGMTPQQGAHMTFPEHDLKAGDEIELGNTVFKVAVFVPMVCVECSAEIPRETETQTKQAQGVSQCQACRKKAGAAKIKEPPKPRPKLCAKCGREVAAEMGENRQGEFICASCKADPFAILTLLLERAKSGDESLFAIQGYEFLEKLGEGGCGAVCLARHEKSSKPVALKVMLPRVALDANSKELFLRETANTKALDHRHVVKLLDYGCSGGSFFFTVEFCDGGSVDKLMKQRGGTLSIEEAGPIILQALAGLEYAHQAEIPNIKLKNGTYAPGRGLVHRDIKPQNLFLCGSGSSCIAKVGDYGLSKAFDNAGLSGQTMSGTMMGTPAFMPRQQVVNFKYAKPEVDVWSMAASLYFMLTGFVPRDFQPGKDPWQTVLQTNAVPIRQRKAAIPQKLAEFIDQALVDKPEIHFKTAAELRKALERVV
jgi:serine/threonine-protein kinase